MISVIRNGHCSVTVQISPVKVYVPISRFCSPITMEIFIFIFCFKVLVNLTEIIKFCFSNLSKLPFCDIAVHIFPCVLIIIVNNIVLLYFYFDIHKKKIILFLNYSSKRQSFLCLTQSTQCALPKLYTPLVEGADRIELVISPQAAQAYDLPNCSRQPLRQNDFL